MCECVRACGCMCVWGGVQEGHLEQNLIEGTVALRRELGSESGPAAAPPTLTLEVLLVNAIEKLESEGEEEEEEEKILSSMFFFHILKRQMESVEPSASERLGEETGPGTGEALGVLHVAQGGSRPELCATGRLQREERGVGAAGV